MSILLNMTHKLIIQNKPTEVNWGVSDSSDEEIEKTTEPAAEFSNFQVSDERQSESIGMSVNRAESPEIETRTSVSVEPGLQVAPVAVGSRSNSAYIADGTETGGETDIFSDEAETDAEKKTESATGSNLKRNQSSSSSNSSWSSSENDNTKEM